METLRWWQKGLVGVSLAVLAFLYIPIVILVVFSFNDSKVTSFPLAGFTFRWYEAFLANEQMLRALANSLIVALFATALSVIVGVTAALALDRVQILLEHRAQRLADAALRRLGVGSDIVERQHRHELREENRPEHQRAPAAGTMAAARARAACWPMVSSALRASASSILRRRDGGWRKKFRPSAGSAA